MTSKDNVIDRFFISAFPFCFASEPEMTSDTIGIMKEKLH